MITPSQIREKKISTVESGGYDRDEVNELLLEIIESYEAVFDENKELYRKMEILANRIEEYRADEDSIKTALITAQKMATQVTREAKEKAEQSLADSAASAHQTVVDAQEKAEKIIGEARAYVAGLTKEKAQAADEIISEAQKKANEAIDGAKVVADNALMQAKKLADKIVNKAKEEKDYHSEIVAKLKNESKDFRATLVDLYETQLDKLKNLAHIPESSDDENESIEEIEKELNILMSAITDVIGEGEKTKEEVTEEANEPEGDESLAEAEDVEEIDEIDEEPEDEVTEHEESTDTESEEKNEYKIEMDEVDEIIDELESANTYEEAQEEDESPTEEEVSNALDAFSTDEMTPIDESVKTIPIIDEEPEFENAMPFESFFNVKKETERTNETISLIPPEEEEDDGDSSKFRGFFKKKK